MLRAAQPRGAARGGAKAQRAARRATLRRAGRARPRAVRVGGEAEDDAAGLANGLGELEKPLDFPATTQPEAAPAEAVDPAATPSTSAVAPPPPESRADVQTELLPLVGPAEVLPLGAGPAEGVLPLLTGEPQGAAAAVQVVGDLEIHRLQTSAEPLGEEPLAEPLGPVELAEPLSLGAESIPPPDPLHVSPPLPPPPDADGLQQALEVKEGLQQNEGVTLAPAPAGGRAHSEKEALLSSASNGTATLLPAVAEQEATAAPRSKNALYWAVGVAAVGSFMFGYAGAAVNVPLQCLGNALGLCSNTLPVYAVSCNDLGGVTGALLAGIAADALGRAGALRAALASALAGSLLCGVAPSAEVFAAGRILTGVASGLASMLTPLYIGEMAPECERAKLAVFSRVAFVVGQLSGLVVGSAVKAATWLPGATAALDSFWWRPIFMVAAGVALAALTASSVGVTPETAPWLARRGRVRAAASTLTRTRNIGRADAEAEARELATASAGSTAGSQSMLDLLRPEYRRMALTGIGLSSLQALSGANALVYFTATIFTSVGVGSPGMAAIATGAANLLGCLCALHLVSAMGRKPLLMGSFGGMALSMATLSAASAAGMPLVAAVAAPMALFCFACGVGPLPYLLYSEMFPACIRARAASACTAFNWIGAVIVGRSFLPLMNTHGTAVAFGILAVTCAAGLLYTWFLVPETKPSACCEVT